MAGHRTGLIIERAEPADAGRLTEIAFAAKRHWNYPEAWISLWEDELTILPRYIESNRVFRAVVDNAIVACCALEQERSGWSLEHFWVTPEHIGTGIGRRLLAHAFTELGTLGAKRLTVISDPHAEGFYRCMGAKRVGQFESRPAGRKLPVLEFTL